MSGCSPSLLPRLLLFALCSAAVAEDTTSFDASQKFLNTYCKACHIGKAAQGEFDVQTVATPATLQTHAQKWTKLALRVRNGDMPPKGAPSPALDVRDQFVNWVDTSVRNAVCAANPAVRPSPVRRLNRDEYSATVRDLLSINMDVGQALPVDGAGGEGFDNAAETLFLSPIHAEKYLEAAKSALDFAAKDARARNRVFIAKPGPRVTESLAARRILRAFLPRAFRRPVTELDFAPYLSLYRDARKQGEPFDDAVLLALRGVLVSPSFLFRTEDGPPDYRLASRLSYFLWGTMPDELLFDIAATGRLSEPQILRSQIGRMLRSPRSMTFAHRFVEQWLRTRDLGRDKSPDPALFAHYASDEELRSDIRYQPIVFFRELLMKNESLLNLIDSNFTMATRKLVRMYGLNVRLRPDRREALHRISLPEGSDRGGLLGMAAVLTTTSYPNRTSPVLRGAWILDAMLGTPPPPPPPNVPALEEAHAAANAKTGRERLAMHRDKPACAGCHAGIDPLGFALENYDAVGQWRSKDADQWVDSGGELPDGTPINGPVQLKNVLLQKKDLVIRNLTGKMLGYALGRGLAIEDSCTVDEIVAQLKASDYRAPALVEGIVFSRAFLGERR